MTNPPSWLSKVLTSLDIGRVWALAALVYVFLYLNTLPITPNDSWWHMRAGAQIVLTQRIPTVDQYSFTVFGQSYINGAAFWLVECIMYLLYSIGGAPLLILANTVTVTAACAILLRLCLHAGHSYRIAAACVLFAAIIGCTNWAVRPQTMSYLLGATTMWAIASYRERPRRWLLVAIPAMILVWVNSHGSFVIGLVLVAIWLADEVCRLVTRRSGVSISSPPPHIWPPLLALGLSAVAVLCNPSGARVIGYLGGIPSNQIIRSLVSEWAPTSLASPTGKIFLAGMLFCSAVLALSPRRPSLFQMLTFLTFAALGLAATRSTVWFGLVMAPILAEHVAALASQIREVWPRSSHAQASHTLRRVYINYIVAGLLLISAIITLPWFKQSLVFLPGAKAGLISSETPVGATRVLLEQSLPGNLFNDLIFGSYLSWAAWPEYQVFIDPRLEIVFTPEVVEDYMCISLVLCDWDAKLQRYGVNTMMLSPREQPRLVAAVAQSASWRTVYRDNSAVILVRAAER